jgi:hypothetical protein
MNPRLIILLLFSFPTLVYGQADPAPEDTIEDPQPIIIQSLDSIARLAPVIESSDKSQLKDPKRAALYSAVLPGLGQAYNNKYWKIPILYLGFGALAYWIDWNNDRYNLYRGALFDVIDGDPDTVNPFPGFSESQLRQATDSFRRNRDVLVILTAVLYGLNIVDAHVDAHLKEFDINEDLALSLKPASINTGYGGAAGLSITLNIK